MVKGEPVNLNDCPHRRCHCGPCAVCKFPKHSSIHGGVYGKPGVIFGHKFEPEGRSPVDTRTKA